MFRRREGLGKIRWGRQEEGQREAPRSPARTASLGSRPFYAGLFDEVHALAYATKVFLSVGRSSDAPLQSGHGNAVGRRRKV
jgi:hypothetical protein